MANSEPCGRGEPQVLGIAFGRSDTVRLGRPGFTILELLVAAAVFSLILVILAGIVSNTSALTRSAGDKISAFQSARAAFALLSANLSQATLNSYWDYDNPSTPARYLRASELHFLVGLAGTAPFPGTAGTGQALFFQAPLGFSQNATIPSLPSLLNACGFYVEYNNADALPAPFPTAPPRYRYRLMQALEVSENLSVYSSGNGSAWVNSAQAVPIAENVIYLAVWPRRSPADDPAGDLLTTSFSYDSRLNAKSIPQPITANQMPPVVQVTMVVLDETSAGRVCVDSLAPSVIRDATAGLFVESRATKFDDDLGILEARLSAAKLNFRVFSALIAVRESKME